MINSLNDLRKLIRKGESEEIITLLCQREKLKSDDLESSKLTALALEKLLIPEGETPEDENGDPDHDAIERRIEEAIASFETELKQRIEAVKAGDLSSVEEMLTSQLNLLNLMFLDSSMKLNALICEGYLTKEHSSPQVQRLADFTLRLQNQTVKTARLITDMKRPRQTTFIKKYVSQQLNQLITDKKLRLGESKNEEMDFRGTPEAIGVNQDLEALGEIDGTTQHRGKGDC